MKSKYCQYIAISSIFVIPLASCIAVPGTNIWYPQMMATLLIGCLIFSAAVSRINIYLAILAAYSAISYFFIAGQHPRSFFCLILCYVGISVICILSKLKDTLMPRIWLISMTLFQFILIILQIFNVDPIFHDISNYNQSAVVGLAGSANQVAYFYGALVPYSIFLIPISLLAIFYSKCSTVAIAVFIGLSFLAFITKKKLMLAFMAIFLICSVIFWSKFDMPMGAFRERVKIWNLTIDQVFEGKARVEVGEGIHKIVTASPLLGYGIGKWFLISPNTQDEVLDNKKHNRHVYEHAHNDYLELLFDFGIIGVFIIFGFTLDIIKKLTNIQWNKNLIVILTSIIIQLVSMFGIYSIHAPTSYIVFCFTLGMLMCEVNNAKENEKTARIA